MGHPPRPFSDAMHRVMRGSLEQDAAALFRAMREAIAAGRKLFAS